MFMINFYLINIIVLIDKRLRFVQVLVNETLDYPGAYVITIVHERLKSVKKQICRIRIISGRLHSYVMVNTPIAVNHRRSRRCCLARWLDKRRG